MATRLTTARKILPLLRVTGATKYFIGSTKTEDCPAKEIQLSNVNAGAGGRLKNTTNMADQENIFGATMEARSEQNSKTMVR